MLFATTAIADDVAVHGFLPSRADGCGAAQFQCQVEEYMEEGSPAHMFAELHGEQLSAVTFVQSYLQLSFDGPCINVTNPLTVHTQTSTVTSWQPGFRDVLCAQIGKVVSSAAFVAGEALAISFADNTVVSVSMRASDYTSAEAISAYGFKNRGWFVA